jgi:hypothetical protein
LEGDAMSCTARLPVGPDEQYTPGGRVVKKVEVYGWTIEDRPGTYLELDKLRIRVDHAYQRKRVNAARVNRIASRFAWYKFGVLVVFRHSTDGTWWCVDGQHRLLAALKRSDIALVPCMVFDCDDVAAAAAAFLGLNADRGAVGTMDKFNALVAGADETAQLVRAMVEGDGYRIAYQDSPKTVRCISAIYRAAQRDFAAAEVAWRVCLEICDPDPPHDRVFTGVFGLERAVRKAGAGSLLNPNNLRPLKRARQEGILQAIRAASNLRNSGGPRVAAEGVACVVNKGRRSNFVPNMAPGSGAGGEADE